MEVALFQDYINATKTCPDCGKSCTTPRGCLIGQILAHINRERKGTPYKPLSFMAVSRKLSHLKDMDIRYVDSICKDAENRRGSYGKCFFGCLKA